MLNYISTFSGHFNRSSLHFILLFTLLIVFVNFVHATYDCDRTNCIHGICWSELSNSSSKPSELSKDFKSCYCDNGFTGYQCSINYDDCLLNQCRNGGKCIDKVAGFDCVCPPGFTGQLCQTEINECLSSPCLSGGSCVDRVNGFHCLCPPGFSGAYCEIDKTVCNETEKETKCLNGGQCLEGPGLEFKCHCLNGFKGDRCQTIINQCDPNPCFNGTRCISQIGDFSCVCPSDRTGKLCESLLVPCEVNDCQHGAVCLATSTSPQTRQCYCVPGFYGINCERHFNECMPAINVCANDGLCIEGPTNYSCSCLNGFKGKHCEISCSTDSQSTPDPRCSDLTTSTTENLFPYQSSSNPMIEPSMTLEYPEGLKKSTEPLTEASSISMAPENRNQFIGSIAKSFDQNEMTIAYDSTISISPSPTSFSLHIGSISTPLNNFSFFLPPSSNLNEEDPSALETKDAIDLATIFSPKFNGRSSYMIVTTDEERYISSLTINLSFSTLSPNGTLLSTQSVSDSRYFIIIYLKNYRLKVSFSCNSQEMDLMEFPRELNQSTLYPLTFQLVLQNNSCTARLTLNHNYTIIDGQSVSYGSSRIPLWPCFRDFYLGQTNSRLRSLSFIDNGNYTFKGCLQDINIDGVRLIKRMVDIEECSANTVCLNNPCNGRGQCLQSSSNWSCLCSPGYSGRRCHLADCSPNPCQNDGLCLATSSFEFNCLCNNGWFGEYCQLDFNNSLPAFGYKDTGSSSSYMIYGLLNQTSHFELRFRFMTTDANQNNSLILFLGNTNNIKLKGRPTDFLSLSLLDDMVVYQINMGQGTKVMVGKMNNTKVHAIYIGQHRQLAWLVVDGLKRDLEVVQTRYNRLNVEPYLYVGNHKASPLRTFTTFRGKFT
ncbi:uncharacterized protein LOC107368337 [Tetranychus urticae]|uniref:uncharacterized protein LOC107368337 n=1 Tax=Tetranychus urticae TaxID=32264 RepID=UPI000D65C7F1|nr:uncharacterized protein LOC107368337 [Tetranychus urticae]